MKPLPTEDQVKCAHAEYCRLVGQLPLTFDRMYWWGHWLAQGWSIGDLRTVVIFLQSQIAIGKRFPGSLRWSRLIQDAENFGEEVLLAKEAVKRRPKPPTSQQRALSQLRPTIPEPITTNTRSAAELIADLRKAAGMTV